MQDQLKLAEVTAVSKKEDELNKENLLCSKAKKKGVLFLEIDRVKVFLSLTRLHSRMCIKIYIFKFKKRQANNINNKKNKHQKKQKKIIKKGEYLPKID